MRCNPVLQPARKMPFKTMRDVCYVKQTESGKQ